MSSATDVHDFLRASVLSRGEIDRFLDPNAPSWARFDAQLGYLPNDSRVPDGVDGAISTYTYAPTGERIVINNPATACRIRTYGDSMTQCHQVSDGETWQEYLSAHIGERVENFGMGGYGVYQAAQRLRRVEGAAKPRAGYVVFNVFLDDHYRSIDAFRLLRLGRWWRDYDASLATSMFHANPWQHVRLDATSGRLIEQPNPCPTPESLFSLCDPDFMVQTFEYDFVVQLLVSRQTGDYSFVQQYTDLADLLGVPTEAGAGEAGFAEALYSAYAFRVTTMILADLKRDLEAHGQQLLVLLSYPARTVAEFCDGVPRPDKQFIAELDALDLPYLDILAAHARDFADFAVGGERYAARLFNGHYSPTGNQFFAFATKDFLLPALVPAPPAYRDRDESFAVQAGRLA